MLKNKCVTKLKWLWGICDLQVGSWWPFPICFPPKNILDLYIVVLLYVFPINHHKSFVEPDMLLINCLILCSCTVPGPLPDAGNTKINKTQSLFSRSWKSSQSSSHFHGILEYSKLFHIIIFDIHTWEI